MKIKSILAHRMIYQGKEYKMCIAQISSDGNSIVFSPFVKEIPGTVFVSGTVILSIKDGGIEAKPVI